MGDGTATKYDYTAGCPDGIYMEHYAVHGGQHNAGGAEIDGAKIDVLGWVSKVELGGGGTPAPPPPSPSPPTPTPPTSGCDNDLFWSGKFSTAHTCEYVAENPASRCFFENSEGLTANDACPGACDSSCSTLPVTLSPVAPPPATSSPVASPADDRPILSGLYTSITLPTGPGGCSGSQEAVLDIYPSNSGSTAAPTVLHLPGVVHICH